MYPSTADATARISLDFRFEGRVVARLRIAADNGRPHDAVSDGIPSYFDMDSIENVLVTADESILDSETPIIVYTGRKDGLSPLLLLEETDYDMELSILEDGVSDAMSYLKSQGGNLFFKSNHFGGEGNRMIYNLYSKCYVGKGFFDIAFNGGRISIPFEIRSRKIEYITEYPKMLSDIAEFSAPMILDHRSPLFRNYSATVKSRCTPYEDYLVMDYVFSKLDFMQSYEFVRNSIHSELVSEEMESVDGCASFMDASDVSSMVSCGNLIPCEGGIIDGRYSPSRINSRCYDDSYDNPENRLVKDLLLTMQSMLHGLCGCNGFRGSDYISGNLDRMRDAVDGFLADEWLSDVGELDRIPFESTILQMRMGYMELFEIYQLLGVGVAFTQDDVADMFEGHNKKVYEVYEYWCFTRLFRALHDMSSNKPSIEPSLKEGGGAITIRRKPTAFHIDRNGVRLNVNLYYNKNFDPDDDGFRSYSIRLRPDYTLVIEKQGVVSIINFDAKYKLKPKGSDKTELDDSKIDDNCWEYDIYKMHTYCDALIRSLGSYVLYPGSKAEREDWIRYTKPAEGTSWDLRDGNVLPSVGSICLTPGSERDGQLIFALNAILDRICSSVPIGEAYLDDCVQVR